MKLFVAGLSYKSAPVEVREKLAVAPGRLRCHGCRLKLAGGLSELVLLSTCNRVEIYGVTEGRVAPGELFRQLSAEEFDFEPYLFVKEGLPAMEHLFAVASGLDSMVLGETEITGQVKQAYLASQGAGLTGKITNKLFQVALHTAKEIRSQTQIGRGATSVGSVAVELAEKIFDQDLSNRTVCIIGAGKMGEACLKHLAKKSAKAVLVVNRSIERAQNLASEFGGQAWHYEQLLEAIAQADIVVSSTAAPQPIIGPADLSGLMGVRRNRPLFFIDIAVPRNIDAAVEQLSNVYLYNVDHLETIVRENIRTRECELDRCLEIIQDRADALAKRFEEGRQRARENQPAQGQGWVLAGA